MDRFRVPCDAPMPERRQASAWAPLLALALTALLVRMAPLLRTGVSWALWPDSTGYMPLADGLKDLSGSRTIVSVPPYTHAYIPLADGLKHGCGFAMRIGGVCGSAELLTTPGYPLFLVLFSSLRSVVAAQALLGTLTCLVATFFAWRQWGPRAALVAALIAGFDLPSIVYCAFILSETLFTLVLATAIVLQLWCLSRSRFDLVAMCCCLLAALLFGWAAMVRPIAQLLVVFTPVPALLLPGRSLKVRAGLALACLAIPASIIVGWSLRNYEKRGIFRFSTVSASNIYLWRAADVTAYLTGKTWDQVLWEFQASLDKESRASGSVEIDRAHEMERRGVAILAGHPWVTAYLACRHFLWLFVTPGRGAISVFALARTAMAAFLAETHWKDTSPLRRLVFGPPLLSILVVLELLLTAFIWVGVVLALRRIRYGQSGQAALVLIPLLATLLLFVLSAGPEGEARFRVPAVPLLAIVAACGWSGLPDERIALKLGAQRGSRQAPAPLTFASSGAAVR